MEKKQQVKKQEGNFSQFSNLSTKADAATQTVSYKKLIRGVLHGARLGYRVSVGNPVFDLDANVLLRNKAIKKTYNRVIS